MVFGNGSGEVIPYRTKDMVAFSSQRGQSGDTIDLTVRQKRQLAAGNGSRLSPGSIRAAFGYSVMG